MRAYISSRELVLLSAFLLEVHATAKDGLTVSQREALLEHVEWLQDKAEAAIDPTFKPRER